MAEKPDSTKPTKPAAPEAPAAQTPTLQYRNLAIAGAVVVALWVLAITSRSTVAMAVLGVLTVALIAGGLWIWRFVQKQTKLAGLLKKAQAGEGGSKEVLEALQAPGADKDAMNLVVRAQLEAQEDPEKAIETIEKVDLKKVGALQADAVRVTRIQLYLLVGRTREAGELADDVDVKKAQQTEERAAIAATVAEAFARSSKSKEAHALLSTYKPEEAANPQLKVPLYYARVFANFVDNEQELVKRDLHNLAKMDINYLGRFVHPKFKVHPTLTRLAQETAQRHMMRDPEARRSAQKLARAQQGRPRR